VYIPDVCTSGDDVDINDLEVPLLKLLRQASDALNKRLIKVKVVDLYSAST